MSERFVKAIVFISVTLAILFGIALTVIGGMIDGWRGVAMMLAGQALYIVLLYLYNRKHR